MAGKVAVPRDGNKVPMVGSTPISATLAVTYDATISASTEITLNASTTFIEVAAVAKGIFMKWGTADVSTTAFDAFIPQDSVRQFVVPPGTTAVNFIEQAASGALVVVEK